MSRNFPYKSFSNYVLRSPLLTFDLYREITSKKEITDEQFKDLYADKSIKEAIFLASPDLSKVADLWVNGKIDSKKDIDRLKFSILKYISRMSSRCTPFGLFAGCSVGKFNDKTNISLNEINKHKRHTRLDMNYLVALSQDLAKIDYIKKQLLFFPNTSIYITGSQLRYIEYQYIKGMRHHFIISVDNTNYLDKVIKKAKEGAKLEDLVKTLVNEDITYADASYYVEELISNQLLVSEFEPSVSGPEFLDQMFSVLDKLNNVDDITQKLKKVRFELKDIDKTIGNDVNKYEKVITLLKGFETEINPKFMFQTDMMLSKKNNTLDKKIIKDIKNGLRLLNKIHTQKKSNTFTKFKDAFYERFEGNEVPLSLALDTESGIGYKQDQGSGDINPLVDDLFLETKKVKHDVKEIQWSSIDTFFHKKLIEASNKGAYTISISENDFKDMEENWNNLPDTFSCMIEMLEINGEQKIKFDGYGGSSAANLLGRFCHGDLELKSLVREITDVEFSINKNKIVAEIVHLPESRVGNILMRPNFREYEIPYLAKSVRPIANQLPINDLMISIKNSTRVILRSKKYNKEVIPRMSNAHNYIYNSLPIYHFLCDLQTQKTRSEMWFNYGPLKDNYEFLPRVEFNNLILFEATWFLKKHKIESLVKNVNDDETLHQLIKQFRLELKLPRYVSLVDGDNQLLVNFENITSVRMLLNIVNKRPEFQLKEFLSGENSPVKQNTKYCTNQIIMSFYNEKKLMNSINQD
ncbi:lantibiotic dehydratase family protein [Pontimicrobium sp. MEBiC06410]